MDSVDKISKWIQTQKDSGRSTSDMDGTIFVLSSNKAARITEADEGNFELEILLPPYAVDLTGDNDKPL